VKSIKSGYQKIPITTDLGQGPGFEDSESWPSALYPIASIPENIVRLLHYRPISIACHWFYSFNTALSDQNRSLMLRVENVGLMPASLGYGFFRARLRI
jgi:hypothetical protein